ncbi:MAG: preprotein translocase subunit SecG [Candidatus Krumholzibacteria bacterium]|nr:preprotein translocase subunit SecG [Candidatus Krumholzibacteria bacterium]
MLFNVFVIVHVVTCALLIVAVLMQSSKGGGLSGAFGGGGGQAILGGRETASFLSKATTYLAVIFMCTSLSLAFLSAGRGSQEAESALRKAAQGQEWGGMIPEERKDVDEVIGNVPESGQQQETVPEGEPAEQQPPPQ